MATRNFTITQDGESRSFSVNTGVGPRGEQGAPGQGAVRYDTAQELTEPEQDQARANIDAIGPQGQGIGASDKAAFREAIHINHVDPRDYGLVAGTSLSSEQRATNTAAIQEALDEAGAAGRPVYVGGGPYEISGELVVNYHGQRIYGDAWNYEPNNKSKIIQTSNDHPAFRIAIPAAVGSTHMIVFQDLWIVGPGPTTSTKAGIDFYLDGPLGSVFSDFNNLKRLRVEGFAQGLRLSKFSNSTIEQCGIYNCYDHVHIGGNCNAVNFIGCQFNQPNAAGGSAILGIGSGYVQVIGCEYGNGGRFLGFAPGSIGMVLDVFKLAVENQQQSTVIATSNIVNWDGVRFLGGSGLPVPIKYEQNSSGAIRNDAMSSYTAGTPVAYGTLTSIPVRTNSGAGSVAPSPVEIYTDSTFTTLAFKYGFQLGKGIADNGSITASEGFRGMTRMTYKRDALGSTLPDTYQICSKAYGGYVWDTLNNSALLQSNTITGTSGNLAINSRYRSTDAVTMTERTLPTSANVDDEIQIICGGAAGFKLKQNASQTVRYLGATTTNGATGYLTLVHGETITLKCISASGAGSWQVITVVGTPVLN